MDPTTKPKHASLNSTVLHSLSGRARELALSAGRAILTVSRDETDVVSKEDGSPLTRADRASHDVIVEGLATLEPKFPIVSEEGDIEASRQAAQNAEAYWLVDPLDGTKEFIAGNGEYTVNIALVKGATPVLGVIYVPEKDRLYYAAKGTGSWRVIGQEEPERLNGGGSSDPITAVISRSHPSKKTDEYLAKLGVKNVIKRGSSLKICAVAEGMADVYPRLGPTWYWDSCAGAVIAREAGCRIVDSHNKSLHYNLADRLKHDAFIVATPETLARSSVGKKNSNNSSE